VHDGPGGKPCNGLLWVVKTTDEHVEATCPTRGNAETRIHNWQETKWVDG
jgi:hypothetical protein